MKRWIDHQRRAGHYIRNRYSTPRVGVGSSDLTNPAAQAEIYLGSLAGGEAAHGMTFSANFQTPGTFTVEYQVIQLISVKTEKSDRFGTAKWEEDTGGYVLDGVLVESGDTPSLVLDDKYTNAFMLQDLQTYLMVRPTGGIWVGVSNFTWKWSGKALRT